MVAKETYWIEADVKVKIFHHHVYRGFGLCEMFFNCFNSTWLQVDMPQNEMLFNFYKFLLIASDSFDLAFCGFKRWPL